MPYYLGSVFTLYIPDPFTITRSFDHGLNGGAVLGNSKLQGLGDAQNRAGGSRVASNQNLSQDLDFMRLDCQEMISIVQYSIV